MTFELSNEDPNGNGCQIMTDGIDLHTFATNPIMLFDHNSQNVIGTWTNLKKKNGKLLGSPVFDESDPEAMKIKSKVRKGIIKGASIGIKIDPKTVVLNEEEGYIVVNNCKLYEVSIVGIPANDKTVKLYVDDLDVMREIDMVELSLLAKNKNQNMKIEKNDVEVIETPAVEPVVETENSIENTETEALKKSKDTVKESLKKKIMEAINTILSQEDDEDEDPDDEDNEDDKEDNKKKKDKKDEESIELDTDLTLRITKILEMSLENIDENKINNTILLSINSLKEENKELKTQIEVFKTKETEQMIDNAIKLGKVAKDQREILLSMALKDKESVKQLIDKSKPIKLSQVLEGYTGFDKDVKADWTIKDWIKNDSNGLSQLKQDFPEKYNELVKATYGHLGLH